MQLLKEIIFQESWVRWKKYQQLRNSREEEEEEEGIVTYMKLRKHLLCV